MDKELFEGLITSVREAVAISKGEMEPSRIFRVNSDGTLSCCEKSKHSESNPHPTEASDLTK